MDFSNIRKLNTGTEASVEYPLFQLGDDVSITLHAAAESNKGYFNALLRSANRNMRAVQNKQVNSETIKRNRAQDRELYAQHVISGWKGIRDASNEIVPFSKETCLEFLEALPDWMFDEIRGFASDIRNFIDAQIDVEETSKN